ncbi:uncharacterized protein LOC122379923 [Amphibalanus amphitrite]|uniref:uncharacterized protein LOC122379923 n=1 Tax=Amphibalanus amphitrite TaxID=1232801 RepID=UPI001C91C3A0|nr:uncharacterized protein LOC122379923 [Amphibalanus amphitrite]
MPDYSDVPVQRGQVTSSCLWTACRALVLGLLLVAAGAAMAALGYYNQQPVRSEAFSAPTDGGPSVRRRADTPRGGHYRHLSYFGSVIMGIGGFIVVASCVMTFEVRDSASKIVPARFRSSQSAAATSSVALIQRSSASQTLPWHLAPAGAHLTRSVSAPCVRGPLPVGPVSARSPPPVGPNCVRSLPSPRVRDPSTVNARNPASTAPLVRPSSDTHRKCAPSGPGAPRERPPVTAAVGSLFRKHSSSVLCALRAGVTRATPDGDQTNYDNRLGRQGGSTAASLVNGPSPGQRRCPSGGYQAFNGVRAASDAQKTPLSSSKSAPSGARRRSESALRCADVPRRREVMVHLEQGSGDDRLLVSRVAPLPSAVVKEEHECQPLRPAQQLKLAHPAFTKPRIFESECSNVSPESARSCLTAPNGSTGCQNGVRDPSCTAERSLAASRSAVVTNTVTEPGAVASRCEEHVTSSPIDGQSGAAPSSPMYSATYRPCAEVRYHVATAAENRAATAEEDWDDSRLKNDTVAPEEDGRSAKQQCCSVHGIMQGDLEEPGSVEPSSECPAAEPTTGRPGDRLRSADGSPASERSDAGRGDLRDTGDPAGVSEVTGQSGTDVSHLARSAGTGGAVQRQYSVPPTDRLCPEALRAK